MESGMEKLGEENEFEIVVEGQVIDKTEDFISAMALLIVCHYVFNLAYPENLTGTFTFFQKFILKISDCSKLPAKVSGLINKIKKLE